MKKILIGLLILIIAAFLWWTVSPLFINNEVQDALDPEIAALLNEAVPDTPATNTPESEVPTEAIHEDSGTNPAEPLLPETQVENTPAETATSGLVDGTSTPTPSAAPGPVVRGPFNIEDTPGHPASGQVRVIETAEQTLVRFEDYNGTNGPDLRIYLATDLDATEFVDLGKPRGNMGNINYTIPSDIDLDDYTYVMTWCRAFGVLFDYAELK